MLLRGSSYECTASSGMCVSEDPAWDDTRLMLTALLTSVFAAAIIVRKKSRGVVASTRFFTLVPLCNGSVSLQGRNR